MDDRHIKYISSLLLPEDLLLTDNESYRHDWCSPRFSSNPGPVAFPRTTLQVSQILSYCHQESIAVVPSGGRTGLAGGSVATPGTLVLAMDKMNRIGPINENSTSVEVEAGAILSKLQMLAAHSDRYFPLDIAAKGSCQIGGNIATNAGGLKFIRYGGMRNLVLGIEVVLPDGTILDMCRSLEKDNSGYDLKHLFIGSEGTLGIITRAQLKLLPLPVQTTSILVTLNCPYSIRDFRQRLEQEGLTISSLEFFDSHARQVVARAHPTLRFPLSGSEHCQFTLIVEIESTDIEHTQSILLEIIESCFDSHIIDDGHIPHNKAEKELIWQWRELITESLAATGAVYKNDLSFPIASLYQAIDQLAKLPLAEDLQLIQFGHAGDGNIHLNYHGPNLKNNPEFVENVKALERKVEEIVLQLGGGFSAEHGIGLLKKQSLSKNRSVAELALMKSLKMKIDPKNILNPTKIFDF